MKIILYYSRMGAFISNHRGRGSMMVTNWLNEARKFKSQKDVEVYLKKECLDSTEVVQLTLN